MLRSVLPTEIRLLNTPLCRCTAAPPCKVVLGGIKPAREARLLLTRTLMASSGRNPIDSNGRCPPLLDLTQLACLLSLRQLDLSTLASNEQLLVSWALWLSSPRASSKTPVLTPQPARPWDSCSGSDGPDQLPLASQRLAVSASDWPSVLKLTGLTHHQELHIANPVPVFIHHAAVAGTAGHSDIRTLSRLKHQIAVKCRVMPATAEQSPLLASAGVR